VSGGERQYEHEGREKARGINAAEPRPQKSSDRLPVSMFAEAVAVHMGQNKTAEKEK
jgi:hypothetical protein